MCVLIMKKGTVNYSLCNFSSVQQIYICGQNTEQINYNSCFSRTLRLIPKTTSFDPETIYKSIIGYCLEYKMGQDYLNM